MPVQLIEANTITPTPWRNGGGCTRELFTRPDAAETLSPTVDDDWALRISLADIDRDGPFSAFPGVQRWFVVVQGAGVHLSLPEGEVHQTLHSPPLHFDGAAAPGCRLLGGPTRDLNLMVRRGHGVLRTVTGGVDWDERFDERGLFALTAGTWRSGRGESVAVPAFTLLWSGDGSPCRFEPAAPGPCGWWVGHSEEQ
jgi:environmental stress-induced protein Ves